MPAPFAQTSRALHTDSDRFSGPGLTFAGLVMLLWLYWLLTATIYSYVSSEQTQVLLDPQLVWQIPEGFSSSRNVQSYTQYTIKAWFSAADITHIHPNQPVSIQLLDNSNSLPLRSLKARVTTVFPQEHNVEVLLNWPTHDQNNPLQDVNDALPVHVRMDVAVASYTPLQFLLNTVTRTSRLPTVRH